MFVALLLTGAARADSADPTRPPQGFSEQPGAVAQTPQDAPLVVSSLFLMGAKPYAVVDGQIVRPGDPLADGKVVRIDTNGVWIAIPGSGKSRTSMRQLKWLPEVVKTPAKASANAPTKARMEKK
ncbi:MAG: hypothetical protein Q8O79_06890 [Pseudomonadota bacterium]|nr:hypothetical protein [Pseudomonadota bacterium]